MMQQWKPPPHRKGAPGRLRASRCWCRKLGKEGSLFCQANDDPLVVPVPSSLATVTASFTPEFYLFPGPPPSALC